MNEKPPSLDLISEIDESILDDTLPPHSAMERERSDLVKVLIGVSLSNINVG